jgi:hypothetical protein
MTIGYENLKLTLQPLLARADCNNLGSCSAVSVAKQINHLVFMLSNELKARAEGTRHVTFGDSATLQPFHQRAVK